MLLASLLAVTFRDEASALPAIKARVAKNVSRMREESGLSQNDLGARADLDPGRVLQIEQGGDLPDHNEIWKIAGALGVDPGEIFGGISWTPPVDGGAGFEIEP